VGLGAAGVAGGAQARAGAVRSVADAAASSAYATWWTKDPPGPAIGAPSVQHRCQVAAGKKVRSRAGVPPDTVGVSYPEHF
jgi:hypothetical protein